jgi:bacterioferritin-associated ferredoxin
MIVCSCSLISAKEVAEAVAALRAIDPLAILKPDRVYRSLGKRPACGGCGRLVKELIAFYDQNAPSALSPWTAENYPAPAATTAAA